MNIAILITDFPPGHIGGAELQAQGWAERLGTRHLVSVIARREPTSLAERPEPDSYSVVLTKAPRRVKGWRAVAGIAAVMKSVRAIKPPPDLLLCFETFPPGLAGALVGRRLRVPALVWIRGEAEYRLRDSWYLRWISPFVWERAALVLVQSEKGRTDMLAELAQVAPRKAAGIEAKLAVLGNGLELPVLSPLSADGPVLSVARLVPEKGLDMVIEACAAAGRPLVIAGCGPEQAALEALAAALGADVRFTGLLGREALDELYREASVVVLGSRREGLPNVLLEAMAHGRPVVATPVGGIPDLIDDGVNGMLVPVGDPVALAAVLRRLTADPAQGVRLGAAARRTAEGFEWSRVQPQLEVVLDKWRRR